MWSISVVVYIISGQKCPQFMVSGGGDAGSGAVANVVNGFGTLW